MLAYASHAQEPEWFTTAPVGAIQKVLTQLGWKPHDADLYEINEAFAAVTMAAMHDVDIDHARVNVNGGACALGHPIGATGARILTTLMHALRRARRQARHRLAVHRRRRSGRDGRRAGQLAAQRRRRLMKIQDARAVVTGGASGSGQRGRAPHRRRAAARSSMLDVQEGPGRAAAAALGASARFVRCDVTSEAEVNAAMEQRARASWAASICW